MGSSAWSTMSLTAGLPAHCSPSSPFLAHLSAHLHVCVPTPLALVSSTLGLLSIAAWLFAQLPQIFTNYAVGSTSGLSIFFLIEWCLGDSTNLLGAIFTRQASWQVFVAAYYVFVDLVLVGQYAWYTHVKPRRRSRRRRRSSAASHGGSDDGAAVAADPNASAPRPVTSPPPAGVRDLLGEDLQAHSLRTIHGPAPREKGSSPRGSSSAMMPARPTAAPPRSIAPLAAPKSLLYLSLVCALAMAHPSGAPPQPVRSGLPPPPSSPSSPSPAQDAALLTAGRVLSWSSTLLYLGSRLPQLYKNYVRQSTSGLSAKLFVAAFFGNLFYSTSLLTNPCAWYDMPPYGGRGWAGEEGNDRVEWLALAIPFWLGAAGVLSLDAAVGVQFLMYREEIEKEIVKDEDGRWRRVTGWMRGWAPVARSPGPAAADDPAEAEPLLSQRRRRPSTGAVYGNV